MRRDSERFFSECGKFSSARRARLMEQSESFLRGLRIFYIHARLRRMRGLFKRMLKAGAPQAGAGISAMRGFARGVPGDMGLRAGRGRVAAREKKQCGGKNF